MSLEGLPGQETLGRQLLLASTRERFSVAFKTRVGALDREAVTHTVRYGDRFFHYLKGGLVVVEDLYDNWSLFETAEVSAHKAHIDAWARFARGCWLKSPPKKPGLYPTRDKRGFRAEDRLMVAHSNGGAIDVTRGFVRRGQVTEWVGDWWSEPFPPLPGAV